MNFFVYLAEINVVFMILYAAYRLFFEKDRNFRVRRIYLMGMLGFSAFLPLIPETIRATAGRIAPLSFPLQEITIYANEPLDPGAGTPTIVSLATILYLSVLGLGVLRILFQLSAVLRARCKASCINVKGWKVYAHQNFHGSSFFGWVFLNPDLATSQSAGHILAHEEVHRREWHSIDRLLAEVFVVCNWFNPLSWLFRRSVIQNLEYLADSGVMQAGTDPRSYQISMISHTVGIASVTNQFSHQIKKRIAMLNRNYKPGSTWKMAMFLPLVAIALIALSCSDKENGVDKVFAVDSANRAADGPDDLGLDGELFYVVEEMPAFQGEEPNEFRRYIAQNLRYPSEAKENGVTGKVLIKFVVTKSGKVVIPDQELLAAREGRDLDEVVVVTYRTLHDDDPVPEEKYIRMLQEEVIRVISGSPDWEPGKQRGNPVNVLFTFPVNFVME